MYEHRVRWISNVAWAAASLAIVSIPAKAQRAAEPVAIVAQSVDSATMQDADAVAERLGVTPIEAARQLRIQASSVAATDEIRTHLSERLAGIAIEHAPVFRIIVLLKGDEQVPNEIVDVAGEPIEIVYRAGAAASHVELVQAISSYQAAIRASLIGPPGLGIDQRTGELVAIVSGKDVAREGAEPLRARLAGLTRVPVRLRVVDMPDLDMEGVAGGMRMMGGVPGDARQYVCTAGFVVTDGEQTALATAAHCPDTLRVRDTSGGEEVLPFAGQWGWGNQDVQINLSPTPLSPTFFTDIPSRTIRAVTSARARAGMRAGDVVCHRGERTGFSCSLVELTDFAPAGDLCGGACLPTWTTVSGPVCKGGDSGAPVFAGTTAYGILKGGSYRADGSCAFYFYMSTDYFPTGWRLLMADGDDQAR